MGRPAHDLTGERFGYLVALRRVENMNGRVSFLCRCDCGKETTVLSGNLKSGQVLSCGCYRDGIAGRRNRAKRRASIGRSSLFGGHYDPNDLTLDIDL
jgi:hypothetical protein